MNNPDSPAVNSKNLAPGSHPPQTVSIPGNLPNLHRIPIGREREIQNLQRLLLSDETRLVTITGFGGAGKTTLSIHLAKLLAGEFSGGAYFVNLAALTKIDDIPLEIAHTLKIRYEAGRSILHGLKEIFTSRKVLLILDNFEHLMGGATFVAELLDVLPRLKIIVTSRDPLQLRAEQVYPLPPLETKYAVELFIQRARSVKPDFKPADEDTRAIAELCQRLGGLPLALELAALRAKMFSPQAMLTRLQPDPQPEPRFLSLFSASAKDLPERQQSLRKTIAWSYGLLNSEEQRALRFASVFPGGFGILTLANLLNLDEYRVIELSDSLANKHLVQKTLSDEDEPRFTILEAIREFAWDEIRAQGELNDIKQQYVNLYLDLAQKAEIHLRGAEQTNWLGVVETEYPNLMLALDIGATSPSNSTLRLDGLSIIIHLEQYWMIRAQFNDLIPLSSRALALVEEIPPDDERTLGLKAGLYGLAGTCAWLLSDFERAVFLHETSLSFYRQLGDESGCAFALNNLATNLGEIGDYDKPLKCYKESLAYYQTLDDAWGQARVHWNMSSYYSLAIQDTARASFHLERSLQHAERAHDPYMITIVSLGLGEFFFIHKEVEKAQIQFEQAAQTARQHRYLQILTHALLGLASLALLRGDLAAASACIREGLPPSFEQMDRIIMGEYVRLAARGCALQKKTSQLTFLAGVNDSLWQGVHAYDTLPDMWPEMNVALEAARAELGQSAFTTEYEKGRAQPLEEAIAFILKTCLPQPQKTASSTAMPFESLTEREAETLRLLAQGKTNQKISQELFVTLKTVEKHVANILRKLGVKNRTEAAAWMLENGPA
jgi:predicted ATPase/DNA-binding CsgD family transcriptional regulator